MLRRALTANPNVPSAYLAKWRLWMQQFCDALRGDAVLMLRQDGGTLTSVLECGGAPAESLPARREIAQALGHEAIAQRAACLHAEDAACLPLFWPNRKAFGCLALFSRRGQPCPPEHVRLLELVRRLIEADFRALHFVRAIDEHKNQLEERIAERTRELRSLNERLAQELNLSQRTAQLLKQLALDVQGSGGHSYFRQLVRELSRMLGAEHAFVARLDPQQPNQARTIACYSGGRWRDALDYPLAGTPGAQTLTTSGVTACGSLAQDFPESARRTGLDAEAYLGIALLDETGRPVGLLAALGGPSILDAHLAHEILELLAVRTSTEIRRLHAEDELRRRALQDELTGLPNRSHFKNSLEQAIARTLRDHSRLALLFIDLDNFKTINDSLGHDIGDAVLLQIARTLQECMREMDTVARLGGDEFAAMLPGVDSLQVDMVCERIMQALRKPMLCKGYELFVSASIGCGLCPEDGADSGGLIRAADAAMYRAKAQGKNQVQFYALDIKRAIQRDLLVGNRLRKAIDERALYLEYQPKVRLADGSLVGAEALCRWHDEVLGQVAPGEFIPIADRTGVAGDLGTRVIEGVIADLLAWRAQRLELPTVAVNVSAKQLQARGFVDWLSERLQTAGLTPRQLILELTEDVLMERREDKPRALEDLVEHGFRISVDDFGTGYSSLAYLKHLPISELKIDRSFITHIASDQGDQAIAAAILTLAHTLRLEVVAEGVEDAQQTDVLKALHCDFAQGYAFHRPLSPTDFGALLAQQPTPLLA